MRSYTTLLKLPLACRTVNPTVDQSNCTIRDSKLELNYGKYTLERQVYDLSNFNKNSLCWWCCHTFQNKPFFIPLEFNNKRNTFKVKGHFCSHNCAYTYYRTSCPENIGLFRKYMLDIYGYEGVIKEAPARESLKIFGGIWDITAYRMYFTDTRVFAHKSTAPNITIVKDQLVKTTKKENVGDHFVSSSEIKKQTDFTKQTNIARKRINNRMSKLSKVFG